MKQLLLILLFSLNCFIPASIQAEVNKPFAVAWGAKYDGETIMPHIRKLGINATKLYIFWSQIEPTKGMYDWTAIDKFVAQLDSESEVLIAVWSSSPWAVKKPLFPRGSMPLNMEDYRRFITKLVKRCQGKVKYWQNDCEPNSRTFWNGTPQEFVSTLKVFYQAVKAADPSATVIVGGHNGGFTPQGTPGNQAFFDYVFRAGNRYFDKLDIRLYDDPYTIASRVNWFRNRMAEFGFSKPIVTTEYGGPKPYQFKESAIIKRYYSEILRAEGPEAAKIKTWKKLIAEMDTLHPAIRMFFLGCPPEEEAKRGRIQARDMVIRSLLCLSAGVEKLWLWELSEQLHPGIGLDPIFGKFRLMDEKLKPLPAYYSYQRMIAKLKGVKTVEQIPTLKSSEGPGNKTKYNNGLDTKKAVLVPPRKSTQMNLFHVEKQVERDGIEMGVLENGVPSEQQNVYLFRVEKHTGPGLHVIWEKRDLFDGEDQPPTKFLFNINAQQVKITDVFGRESIKVVSGGTVELGISDTPLYLEAIEVQLPRKRPWWWRFREWWRRQ